MDELDLRYLIPLKSKQVLILELYGRESLENCILHTLQNNLREAFTLRSLENECFYEDL